MDWYALFVLTGEEENVVKWLHYFFDNELRALIPKRKLTERRQGKTKRVIKKIFPGYVLVNVKMDLKIYYIFKKIPHLIRIVKSGDDYYSKVSQKEMNIILHLLDDDDVIDYSKVYLENSKVRIRSGPLNGMEGLIKAVDKRKLRIKIELQFMGQAKEFDVGMEVLD